MTDKQKILQYLEYKGISKNKFYIKTGFSVGFLDSGSSLGVDKLRIIIDNYHDLNLDWIVTGKGEMLKQDKPIKQTIDCEKTIQNLEYTIEVQKELIDKLKQELKNNL